MFSKSRLVLLLNLIFPALTAISLLVAMPDDGQNAIMFGLSKSRLMVAMSLWLVTMFFIGLVIFAIFNSNQLVRWLPQYLFTKNGINLFVRACGFAFFLAGVILCIPDKYLGSFGAIQERLHPLLTWILLTSLQGLICMVGWQIINKQPQAFSKEKIIATITVLGITVLTWYFIAISGLGLISANTFWSKIGVPVLWPQIFFALIISLALQHMLARTKLMYFKNNLLDIGIVIIIWVAAVILWSNQSYVQGVFNTSPKPPTYEIYPINDSYIFDVAAQKMLVGQTMISDVHDKPIYISFLAILHFVAGTSYSRFYFLQIMCFALIPVCGYFIGKVMHSRPLGLMFSILLILKELNAIALTNYIHVSTSKMILSESLTSLGLLVFTLFLFQWTKSNSLKITNPYLWIAGGVLGLTCLARLNSIGILPAAIIIIGVAAKFNGKRWMKASLVLIVFVLISALPWMARNFFTAGDPFNFIKNKTTGVIINQRYDPIIPDNSTIQTPNEISTNYFELGRGIGTNYLHNLIGITLMLPPSVELYSLLDLIRLPYWKLQWDGSLLPGGFWVILGVLCILSSGIASAWIRWRVAGLVPLSVILGYNITTALSLTSGGRYLVPIDWGVLLYFSIGLWDITTWLLALFDWRQISELVDILPVSSEIRPGRPRIFFIGLFFLFLGTIPVFLETFPADAFPNIVNMPDFLKENQALPVFLLPGNEKYFSLLTNNPTSKVIHGKALYPRYFGENKGEGPTLEEDSLIGSADFDRLSFILIGGKDDVAVLLPSDRNLSPLISGADTWVIGCQRINYVEALFIVFRQSKDAKTYWQNPIKSSCR